MDDANHYAVLDHHLPDIRRSFMGRVLQKKAAVSEHGSFLVNLRI